MTDNRWRSKTVIVTGGLGFIGSHFVEELLALGANVICFHRGRNDEMLRQLPSSERIRPVQVDVGDNVQMRAAFKYAAARIDAVIHCAALDGNSQFKLDHPAQILDANLRMSLNVLNCAREYGVENVVLLSSSEVYSAQPAGSVWSGGDYPGFMSFSRNGYVLSKMFAEITAELFREQFDMNIFVARTTNVYGPRDGLGVGSRVIPSMIRRVAAGDEIEIWGDGSQTRTFLYVKDLVHTTLQMIDANKYPTFNVGSGESVSILDLGRMMFDVMRRPERLSLDRSKPTGVAAAPPDISRMIEVIDFAPLPLREGLDRTVRWYERNLLVPQ